MDFNNNGDNYNNGGNPNNRNEQWDRHNSDASHSSYHNQPTHRPYGQGFIMASVACGLMSLTSSCSIIISLPLGALAILFALLAWRKGKKIHRTAKLGLISGCIGMVSALVIMVYTLFTLPELLKDETYRQQFDAISEQMYGMDFEELLESFYGFSLDE